LRAPALRQCQAKPQAQLLARVFEEQFQLVAGVAAPLEEKQVIAPVSPEPATVSEPEVAVATAAVVPTLDPMPEPAQMEMPTGSAAEQAAPAQAPAAEAIPAPPPKRAEPTSSPFASKLKDALTHNS